MANWRDLPRNPSRRDVLDTIENSKRFRNPLRLEDLGSKYPGNNDPRRKDYERIFGTQDKGFAEKGRPFK